MHTLLWNGGTDAQVLAAVRVIVREWAKRNGAPDGLTTAFIKQARRAKRLPRLTMHALHADGTGTSNVCATPVPNSRGGGGGARYNPLNPTNAAVELI